MKDKIKIYTSKYTYTYIHFKLYVVRFHNKKLMYICMYIDLEIHT